jgi:hypothetical protein
MWEMVSGEIPYEGMDPSKRLFENGCLMNFLVQAGIAVASENLRPKIPENCDKDWASLIQKCWHQNPKERPDFFQIMGILKGITS